MHNRVLLTVGPMLYSTYLELIPLYKCNFRPIKQLSSSFLHLLKLHKYSQCIIIQFLPIALHSSPLSVLIDFILVHWPPCISPNTSSPFLYEDIYICCSSCMESSSAHISHISYFTYFTFLKSQLKYNLLKNFWLFYLKLALKDIFFHFMSFITFTDFITV